MGQQFDGRGVRRLDDSRSIVEALRHLHSKGVPMERAEGELVRMAPVDLDLLAEVLRDLRSAMARNDPAPDARQPASRARRHGRFA